MRFASFITNTLLIAACAAGGAWYYRAEIVARYPVVKTVATERLGANPAWFDVAKPAAAGDATKGQGRSGRGSGPVAIVSAVAVKADIPIVKRAIGTVESTAVVNVRSRIDSQIIEQHVKEGQFVKKGDLLFTLDDGQLKAQIAGDTANVARGKAALTKAQSDLARAQQLLARNAGTQQAVEQAKSDVNSATAVIAADQAILDASTLKLDYARIVAPIDGRVGAVEVAPGNLVNANGGSSLVTITTMAPVRVSFNLPERELPLLRKMVEAPEESVVSVTTVAGASAEARGKLSFLDSAVDATSGTITAKATFENADLALWPGQYVNVALEAGMLKDTVTVPTTAIQQGQKGPFVYVVKPDATVELRPVTVAMVDGDRTALASGLAVAEKVVVEGQLRLKNGSTIREPEAEASAMLDAGGAARPEGSEQNATPGQRPVREGTNGRGQRSNGSAEVKG